MTPAPWAEFGRIKVEEPGCISFTLEIRAGNSEVQNPGRNLAVEYFVLLEGDQGKGLMPDSPRTFQAVQVGRVFFNLWGELFMMANVSFLLLALHL